MPQPETEPSDIFEDDALREYGYGTAALVELSSVDAPEGSQVASFQADYLVRFFERVNSLAGAGEVHVIMADDAPLIAVPCGTGLAFSLAPFWDPDTEHPINRTEESNDE